MVLVDGADLFGFIGCHESSEQFPENAKVLLLGYFPLPPYRYRFEELGG